MYTLPKSSNPLYGDPEEKYVLQMDSNDKAVALLTKLPSLTVLYEAKESIVNLIVERYSDDRIFFYEDSQVPDHVVRTIAWRSLNDFVKLISEAIASDPNLQNIV